MSHSWSYEHKVLLCVISRFLKTADTSDGHSRFATGADRTLCHIFARGTGYPADHMQLGEPCLRSMLYTIREQKHPAWVQVFIETGIHEAFDRWRLQIQDLTDTAARLGHRMIKRSKDHPKSLLEIKSYNKALARNISLNEAVCSSRSREQPVAKVVNDCLPCVDDEVESYSKLLDGFANDRSWDKFSYLGKMQGAFGYRVVSHRCNSINSSEGDYAGMWTGFRLPPLNRSSLEFKLAAYKHLRSLKEPSPFLSLTTSFLWAFVMAFKHDDTTLQVISFDQLQAFDASPSYVTPVNPLTKQMPEFSASLTHLREDQGTTPAAARARWTCMTEWLIYGEIPKAAIVANISVRTIKDFLAQHEDVDQRLLLSQIGSCNYTREANTILEEARIKSTGRTGECVGLFLASLDVGYRVAYKLAVYLRAHWITRHRSARKGRRSGRSSTSSGLQYFGGFAQGFFRGLCVHEDQDTSATPLPCASTQRSEISIEAHGSGVKLESGSALAIGELSCSLLADSVDDELEILDVVDLTMCDDNSAKSSDEDGDDDGDIVVGHDDDALPDSQRCCSLGDVSVVQ